MVKRKIHSKSGFSLIEVLLAILILAVLAVGGAAVIFQTSDGIRVEANKRMALEVANRRLETLLKQPYLAIRPNVFDVDDQYYLTDLNNDDVLELKNGKTTELINFGGRNYTMETKVVRWSSGMPLSRPDFSPEHMEITVTAQYRGGADETVSLTTYLIPPTVTTN